MTSTYPGGASLTSRLLAVPYAARAAVADSVVSHGSVVQMGAAQTRDHALYTAPNSGNGAGITPLDIVITPRKAGNWMVLEWVIHGEIQHNALFTVTRNGQLLQGATNSANSRWSGVTSALFDENNDSTPFAFTVKVVDGNTLAEQTTYRVHVRASGANARTFSLNRPLGSAGSDDYETGISVGTATEIWRAP